MGNKVKCLNKVYHIARFLRGMDTLSTETTLTKLFLPSSEKGSILKGNTLLSGANSKCMCATKQSGSYRSYLLLKKINRKSTSISSPLKMKEDISKGDHSEQKVCALPSFSKMDTLRESVPRHHAPSTH